MKRLKLNSGGDSKPSAAELDAYRRRAVAQESQQLNRVVGAVPAVGGGSVPGLRERLLLESRRRKFNVI